GADGVEVAAEVVAVRDGDGFQVEVGLGLLDELGVHLFVFAGALGALIGGDDLEGGAHPGALLGRDQAGGALLAGRLDCAAVPLGGAAPPGLGAALAGAGLLAEAILAPLALVHHALEVVQEARALAQAVALAEALGILLHLLGEAAEGLGEGLLVHG